MRLFAIASGLALLAGTPALALTISSAPPSRDAAQHLKPSDGNGAAPLRDGWAGGGRPAASSGFSNGTMTMERSSSQFEFGPVRGTMSAQPRDSRWLERRETPAPMGLVPRR